MWDYILCYWDISLSNCHQPSSIPQNLEDGGKLRGDFGSLPGDIATSSEQVTLHQPSTHNPIQWEDTLQSHYLLTSARILPLRASNFSSLLALVVTKSCLTLPGAYFTLTAVSRMVRELSAVFNEVMSILSTYKEHCILSTTTAY